VRFAWIAHVFWVIVILMAVLDVIDIAGFRMRSVSSAHRGDIAGEREGHTCIVRPARAAAPTRAACCPRGCRLAGIMHLRCPARGAPSTALRRVRDTPKAAAGRRKS